MDDFGQLASRDDELICVVKIKPLQGFSSCLIFALYYVFVQPVNFQTFVYYPVAKKQWFDSRFCLCI